MGEKEVDAEKPATNEVGDEEPLGEQTIDEAIGSEPHHDDETLEGGRRSRLFRAARRLIDTREISSDTREIIGSVLGASDRAKTEAVRMAAREVRNYLDELKLKDDILNLMTSYSLEVSISLKPLADAVKRVDEPEEHPDDDPLPDGEPA